MSEVILAKATGAGNSSDIVVDKYPLTVIIYPEANFGADTADLKIQNPDGTYDDVYDDNGQVILSASRPQAKIVGAGVYRLEFAARTAAIGAYTVAGPRT